MNKISAITSQKDLIHSFVSRDLKARYRGSILGFLWSFIDPLSNALVLWFVFTYIFARGIANFPLFLITGIVMWTFLSGSISQSARCIIDNGGILKKIRLTREIFPVSTVISNFIHFLFAFVILLIIVVITQPPFNPIAWLFLPLILFLFALFAIGLSLLVAAGSVYFRDLPPLVESFLKIWYFATPIFYALDRVPERFRFMYMLNPAASAITTFRQAIMEGHIPSLKLLLSLFIIAVISLIIGLGIFSRLEKGFADEV